MPSRRSRPARVPLRPLGGRKRRATPAAPQRGPGLRKARSRAFASHHFELWRIVDYELSELFEHADVMSEGAARVEGAACVYYGATSILLPMESRGGKIADALLQDAVEVLRRNPHARTRAVRIACREAQVRCAQPLSRVHAELSIRGGPEGIHIDVEVEAPVRLDTALVGGGVR